MPSYYWSTFQIGSDWNCTFGGKIKWDVCGKVIIAFKSTNLNHNKLKKFVEAIARRVKIKLNKINLKYNEIKLKYNKIKLRYDKIKLKYNKIILKYDKIISKYNEMKLNWNIKKWIEYIQCIQCIFK